MPLISSFVEADMNGDGLPDLVYLQGNGPEGAPTYPSVAVLINNGSGYVSQPVVSAPLACFAGTPIAADVNGDNKQDAILSCNGFLVVMLGNGDGTFQAPSTTAAPGLSALLAVDLNGDGYPDIIGVDSSTSGPPQPAQLSILLNKGVASPGNFGSATSISGGGSTILSGDFNGDGKQDVLIGAPGGGAAQNPIDIYFGNGDGTLQAPVSVGSGSIYTFTTGDWNGDGVTDIAYVATPTTNAAAKLIIASGSTSGQFTTSSSFSVPTELTYSQLLALKHPNATGYNAELALVGDFTTLFFGDASGNFVQGPGYSLSTINGTAIEQVNSDNSTALQYFSGGYLLSAPVKDSGLQALPADAIDHFGTVSAYSLGFPSTYALGDLNGDGLPDLVSISSTGELAASLSRGNGGFTTFSPVTTQANGLLIGDFNGDGKQDVLGYISGVSPSSLSHGAQQLPQTLFYQGSGIGTLPATPVTTTLPLTQISVAASGDFNGDHIADLIIVALGTPNAQQSSGIFFLAGKGDGTFATPILLDQAPDFGEANLLVADINNDGKLDFVFENASFVGNGDGTFKATPLGLASNQTPATLGDVNGDGFADMVTSTGAILAGKGDGTFQTSSLYSITIPEGFSIYAASIGDVTGDGNADVVAQLTESTSSNISWLSVLQGDGKGGFVLDPQTYYAGITSNSNSGVTTQGLLTRLNSTAPPLTSDTTLDFLSVPGPYIITPLLNAHNAAPTSPVTLPSAISLSASSTSVTTGTQITLTANVSGYQPGGQVTFNSGSTSLGTASLTDGVATLPVSFSSAASYAITATYSGDTNNSPSTSNTVTLAVTAPVAPDFQVTANPTTATVTRGQSATTTLTVTPDSTYAGSVTLTCGTLPSGVTCSFAPATVSTASGAATSVLTITTTAPSTAALVDPINNLAKAAWAGIFCLALLPFGRTSRRWKSARASFFCLCLATALFALSACGGGSSSSSNTGGSTPTNPGTPTGQQTVTVQVSDSSNSSLSHSVPFTLTVQ
ncbi:FG-GAP-like repeat-containing protein [Silvibacterium acidisoli]|uniref:FG-GAP-like repeat-containing protein n=1 Tax=Acidobacteriaceae bacterium ZG23-2 TaxID=2883246 RepID=UPI00406CABF4